MGCIEPGIKKINPRLNQKIIETFQKETGSSYVGLLYQASSLFKLKFKFKQDAQLSQRDRAAGCVILFAKSRTLELGDNDLRTL